ncbi:MAG: hypothetical protein ACLP1Y_06945 [Candidatus Acidiferrales bacterium]
MSVSAASNTVFLGATDTITATVTGTTNTNVTWSAGGVAGGNSTVGTITAAGVYTAPAVLPQPPSETITATSTADTSKSASVTLTIASGFTLAISGPTVVNAGASGTYEAMFTPAPGSNPSTAIDWSISGPGCTGASCGLISSGGNYQAPASAPSPNSIIITATPLADPSKATTMIVTIQPNVQVTISPTSVNVPLGGTTGFQASVTGSANTLVTWEVNGIAGGNASAGTIAASMSNPNQATYTAPRQSPAGGSVSVEASSNAEPSEFATASVSFTLSISISLSPASGELAIAHRQTFTAQLQNATNANVTWSVQGIAGGNLTVGQVCVTGSNPCQTFSSGAVGSVDYVAPAATPTTNPVTLTATSQQDSSQTASAAITILPHVLVSVTPSAITLAPNAIQPFQASVAGTSDQQVNWGISGTACASAGSPCGTVAPTGLYTAPPQAPSPNTLSVVATSVEDASQPGSAAVTLINSAAILSISPASATAGAAGGITLRITGSNFVPSSPGPGSTILFGGTARSTVCDTSSDCTTALQAADLATPGTISVQIENPDQTKSNTMQFVVVAAGSSAGKIPLTPSSPSASGINIVVADLSTAGSSAPASDVNLNVVAIGPFATATNTCTLGGGPVVLSRPATGTATEDVCVFSVSGLAPSFSYTLTGPNPADVSIVAEQPLGFGIVQLTLEVPSTAVPGARTLFIENPALDVTAATGALEVQ